MGRGSHHAEGGAARRPVLLDPVGADHRLWPHDRLQLVRLRPATAGRHRQLHGGVCRPAAAHTMISPEFLHPYFDWVEHTWFAQLIPNSNWLFPAIEAVHLLGL